jgi:4,5-dihydroxyphthalate decarboxylase
MKGDALMHKRVMDITGGDPMPYGIEPNRAVIENLISHAKKQGILGGSERIEDLFAKETLGLTG